MKEMERYLHQFRVDGTLDSEGGFTVAGLKAVGKLASSLLPEPSDWTLKIVQAATSAKADKLTIKQTVRATQFEFQHPETIDLDRFEKSLVDPLNPPLEAGLADLTIALRAVGVGQQRDWVIQLTQKEQQSVIAYGSGLVNSQRKRTTEGQEGTRISVGVAYPKGQIGKLGGLVRFGEAVQNESNALLSRVRAAPIPIFLDSLRLDNLIDSKGLDTYLNPRLYLGVHLTPVIPDSPSITVPGGFCEWAKEKRKETIEPYTPYHISPIPEDLQAGALVRWYFNYTKEAAARSAHGPPQTPVSVPSRLIFVRRGVVVGKRSLSMTHPVSADVYMSADHLRGDLSGLQVEPQGSDLAIARQHLKVASKLLDEIIVRLTEQSKRPVNRDLMVYGGLGVLSLFAPVLALKAFTGTATALMLAASTLKRHQLIEQCLNHLYDYQVRIK